MQLLKVETEYCVGVDLHWDNMYVCVLDANGEKHVHRSLRNSESVFRKVMAPYTHSLTLAVESTGTWYWLCDLCADMEIRFALGHAQYMKWIHGAKAKNDRIDSEKIARMTLGGNLPVAYAHPKELRATRDLLRRRSRFVSMRTGMMAHIKTINAQENMPALGRATKRKKSRDALSVLFQDRDMAMSIEADTATADYCDSIVTQIERHVHERTKEYKTKELAVLMSTPGVGKILALTIALEIHTIARFSSRQDFCSYSRLINSTHISNGKKLGSAGHKIGNPYLKWAFGEVALHAARVSSGINALRQKLAKKHGPGRSLAILAHKFGRAFYYMLKNGRAFDEDLFLKV